MFEVTVEQTFAAGHALRNYHGKCEDVHGHNYRVRVTVEGEQLDSTGLLVDFPGGEQTHHRRRRVLGPSLHQRSAAF
jgi:6-pyruvoyl-tetrahydropterin synthase